MRWPVSDTQGVAQDCMRLGYRTSGAEVGASVLARPDLSHRPAPPGPRIHRDLAAGGSIRLTPDATAIAAFWPVWLRPASPRCRN